MKTWPSGSSLWGLSGTYSSSDEPSLEKHYQYQAHLLYEHLGGHGLEVCCLLPVLHGTSSPETPASKPVSFQCLPCSILDTWELQPNSKLRPNNYNQMEHF